MSALPASGMFYFFHHRAHTHTSGSDRCVTAHLHGPQPMPMAPEPAPHRRQGPRSRFPPRCADALAWLRRAWARRSHERANDRILTTKRAGRQRRCRIGVHHRLRPTDGGITDALLQPSPHVLPQRPLELFRCHRHRSCSGHARQAARPPGLRRRNHGCRALAGARSRSTLCHQLRSFLG